MPWEYRVVRESILDFERDPVGVVVYSIKVVYFDRDPDLPYHISDDLPSPMGRSLEELKKDLQKMFNSLDKPILGDNELNFFDEIETLYEEDGENKKLRRRIE